MEIQFSLSASLSDRALQDVLIRGKYNVRVLASRKISGTQYLFAYMDEEGDCIVCRATLSQAGLVSNKFVLRKVEPLSTEQTLWHVQKAFDRYEGKAGTSLSAPPPLYSLVFPLSEMDIEKTPAIDDLLRDWHDKFCWMFDSRWASFDWNSEAIEVSLQDPARQNKQYDSEVRELVKACLNSYFAYRRGMC